tara:strand:- start:4 stop:234 length:231 start_codon:yes stop_codon:yes gene_type:complete
MREEEERKNRIENIRLKEWEEKFDAEQKLKEQEEIKREERLKSRELQKFKSSENKNLELAVTTSLEDFEIDKTSEN